MQNIKFKSNSVKPIFIFEYYDAPLTYITEKVNGKYYFFYFINDDQYFIMPLTIKHIHLIFSSKYIKNIFDAFLKDNNFKVIEFQTHEDAVLYNIDEFEKLSNVKIENVLPEHDEEFTYDFVHKDSFENLKNKYKKFFPELFPNTR